MIIMAAAVVAACQKEPAATAVIDENGDCIFENNVVRFRLNGASNPVVTSGFEAILKAVDGKEQVVNDRKAAVAASMNDGGSALVVNDSLYYPQANFDSFEIVEQTPTHVTFTLTYPQWLAGEDTVSLTRTITLRENNYHCLVTDVYEGPVGQNMTVAAGYAKQEADSHKTGKDYILAWRNLPGGDAMGVGILMPAGELTYEGLEDNALGYYTVKFGRRVDYGVLSGWSKAGISGLDDWEAKIGL